MIRTCFGPDGRTQGFAWQAADGHRMTCHTYDPALVGQARILAMGQAVKLAAKDGISEVTGGDERFQQDAGQEL